MTTPPSRWRDSALNLAVSTLAIALMLYVAARLILAVFAGTHWYGRGCVARFRGLVGLSNDEVLLVNNYPIKHKMLLTIVTMYDRLFVTSRHTTCNGERR
jgi:hypothetical protein